MLIFAVLDIFHSQGVSNPMCSTALLTITLNVIIIATLYEPVAQHKSINYVVLNDVPVNYTPVGLHINMLNGGVQY